MPNEQSPSQSQPASPDNYEDNSPQQNGGQPVPGEANDRQETAGQGQSGQSNDYDQTSSQPGQQPAQPAAPDQPQSDETAAAPNVDPSVLNQEQEAGHNSAAVNLASPEKRTAQAPQGEESGSSQTGAYQPQTPPPEDAGDGQQPSKLEATPPPPPAEDTGVTPQQSPQNRKPWILVLIGIIVLALIGGGIWWYMATQVSDDGVVEEPAPEPEPEPEPEPPEVDINSNTTPNATPTITGTVDSTDATVTVIVNGNRYNASVKEDGSWQAQISDQLAPGTYTIYVTTTVEDRDFNEQLINGLTIEEPQQEEEEEEEPEETPSTGPDGDGQLPNTGPGGDSSPQRQ